MVYTVDPSKTVPWMDVSFYQTRYNRIRKLIRHPCNFQKRLPPFEEVLDVSTDCCSINGKCL